LSALVVRYLAELAASGASAGTVRAYRTDFKHWEAYCRETGASLVNPTDQACVEFIGQLRSKYSPATASRRTSSLRALYRWAVSAGHTARMPRIPQTHRNRVLVPRTLSRAEVLGMVDSGPPTWAGARRRALVELFYSTGGRCSEMRDLNMADIDFARGVLVVHGKGRKERMVPLGEYAARALREYFSLGRTLHPDPRQREAVFVSVHGKRMGVDTIRREVRRAARAAGITRRVHPHMLRHSFATHMHDAGADIRDLQLLLGHANIASTQVYTHVSEAEVRTSFEKFHPRARVDEATLPPAS
jgi:site-specific recombinase XerD